MSDDNPRGYTECQLKRIADAPTLSKKRMVELKIVDLRCARENELANPNNDGYGLERISAIEAEIWAEYAAKMADEASDNKLVGDESQDSNPDAA
jgi:hypothetical protein